MTTFYKSKFTDRAHETGVVIVHDPFDPNDEVWDRIEELYNRIYRKVKNDKNLNKAVNDKVKSKRRDSIWIGHRPDFKEKYNYCTKSECGRHGQYTEE